MQGLVHRQATADRAMARGLVGAVSTDPRCLSDCDLVILALPIPLLLNPPDELIAALPEPAVVTDVGSVKQPVLEAWRQRHPRFVASHPMAGTAQAGVEAGVVDLFRGRPWIATPDAAQTPLPWPRFEIWPQCGWPLADVHRVSARPGCGADFPHAGAGECCTAAGRG